MKTRNALITGIALAGLSFTAFAQQETTELQPEEIQQAEETLSQLGYDVGSVDSNWDQQSELAVREFQQAQGLEPSGTLDEPTRAALGMVEIADSVDDPPPAAEFD